MTDVTQREAIDMPATGEAAGGEVAHLVAHRVNADGQPVRVPVTQGPMRLVEMAIQSGSSIDQLERIMAMAERHQANEARQAFVEAMARFKENPPEIIKDKQVSFDRTNYMHATIGAVCDAIIKGLADVGISHSWKPRQAAGQIGIACVLTHRLGHSEETFLEAGADTSGKKNGIQSIGSTTTYLSRYTLLMACGLATKDQDDDGHGHQDPAPTWADEFVNSLHAAETPEEASAIWKVAAATCRRKKDRNAYDFIKFEAEEQAQKFAAKGGAS